MKTSSLLTHITLNSAHSMEIPLKERAIPEVLIALRDIIKNKQGFIPNFKPWRVILSLSEGAASFDIRRNKEDVVTLNIVCWEKNSAAGAWQAIEEFYLMVGDALAKCGMELQLPEMPQNLPWLVTFVLPQAYNIASEQDMSWIPNFEQCLAAAIIHQFKK